MAKERPKTAQWATDGKRFRPAGESVPVLAAGMYNVGFDMFGIYLEAAELHTDELVLMTDSPANQVVANVRKFWENKERFKQLGMLHKRGALLYGAPGCGKTATAEILAKDVIANDGIVLVPENASLAIDALRMVREVEPHAKVVVVLEDLDGMFKDKVAESRLSNLLDGENQVENVVYLATTNFIDKIPDRFRNRPSRFDEVLEIPMPTDAIREGYLRMKLPADYVKPGMIEHWVSETNGLAIAHLRELIVGVVGLDRPFEEVIERLRKMAKVSPIVIIGGKGAEA